MKKTLRSFIPYLTFTIIRRFIQRSFSVAGSFIGAGLTLTFTCAFAQVETNQWRFGYNASVDFNSGVPVSSSGCPISTSEGSASIADASGNLLFYTDGI